MMKRNAPRSRRHFIAHALPVAFGPGAQSLACTIRAIGQGAPEKAPASGISAADLERIQAEIVERHNAYRADVKLSKLMFNRRLTGAAQAHAEDMAGRREMTHTGKDGSSPGERIKARGYRFFRAGENVAAGR